LTAGTRRNGTRKFGPYRLPTDDRPGAPGPQVQDGHSVVEIVDYGSYGFTPDDTIADGAIPSYGHENDPSDVHENAKRYTGRHAHSRFKAARKRAGKAVPAAAVAASLAAGTAAVFARRYSPPETTSAPRPARASVAMTAPFGLAFTA